MKTGTEQTVALFCGNKPFSDIAHSLGYGVFTVDINPAWSPDLTADRNRSLIRALLLFFLHRGVLGQK